MCTPLTLFMHIPFCSSCTSCSSFRDCFRFRGVVLLALQEMIMMSTRNSGAGGHGTVHTMHEGADNWRPALRKVSKCVFPEKPHESPSRPQTPLEWIEGGYIPIGKPISFYEDAHPATRDQHWTSRRHPSIDESIPTYSSISIRQDAGFPSPIAERLSAKPSIRHSTCTQSSVSTIFTEAREDQYDESDIDTAFSSSVPGAFPFTPNSPFNRVARDFSDTSILHPTVYTPPLPSPPRKLSLAASPSTPNLVSKKSIPIFLPPEPAASPPPKAPLPALPYYQERTHRPETPLSSTSRHRDGSGAPSSRFRERSETPSCRRPETPLSISSVKFPGVSQLSNASTGTICQVATKPNYEHDEGPSEYQVFLAQSSSAQARPPLLRTQNLPVLQLQIPQYPPTPCETPQTSRLMDEITSAHFKRARSGSTSTANTSHTPRQHLAQPKLPSVQAQLFSQNKFPVNLKEQLHGVREQTNQPVRPNMTRSHSDTNRNQPQPTQTPITPQVSRFSTDTYNTCNQSNFPSDSGAASISGSSFTSKMRSILPFSRANTPSQQNRDIKICGRAITPVSSSEPRLWSTDSVNVSSHHAHPTLREPPPRAQPVSEGKDRDQERGRSSSRWSNIGKAVKRSLSLDRDGKRNVLRKNSRDRSLSRSEQEGLARRGGAFGEARGHVRGYGSLSAASGVGKREVSGDGREDRMRHSRVMPTSKALDRYNSNVDGMV